MSEEVRKRLKSFAWRLGMMLLAVTLDFTVQNIGIFDLPPAMVTVVGLVLGEVSKFLNNKHQQYV